MKKTSPSSTSTGMKSIMNKMSHPKQYGSNANVKESRAKSWGGRSKKGK